MDEVSGILVSKFGWTQEELDLLLPPLWDRCIIIKPGLRLRICRIPMTTTSWNAQWPQKLSS